MNINLVDHVAKMRGIEIDSAEYEDLKLELMAVTGLSENQLEVPVPAARQRGERRIPEWAEEAAKVAREFCQTGTPEQIEYYRALLLVDAFPRFYGQEAAEVDTLFNQIKPLLAEHGQELLYNRVRNVLRIPRERLKQGKRSRSLRQQVTKAIAEQPELPLDEPEPTAAATPEPVAQVEDTAATAPKPSMQPKSNGHKSKERQLAGASDFNMF